KMVKKQRRSRREMLLTFRKVNKDYIERLQYEAENFIRNTVAKFDKRPTLVSFSGGKDSTVVSHLVMSALGRSDILHILVDTTIELPDTYQYIQDFKRMHPLTP
ncbi:phosphoadenosine phosphosulfate reductase family protein, partial [Desulfococcaceae bacterium HSG7]|nr:phosphoadenosine phosphosulfate reductase family protein [Desulfococcaceae bacterium HSG7]